MNSSSPLVEISDLTYRVAVAEGTLTILEDINLQVSQGESLAVVGTSGSGKSTLLAMMGGLALPSSGKVSLNSHNLSALNESQRAKVRADNLGFVFQDFLLIPTLTALENLVVPARLAGKKVDMAAAQHLLERVGLAERTDHYPAALSGGEQQRVALARAFITQPGLLLADEPTGNLDNATGERVAEMLFELNQRFGTTLVLVTHDLELAKRCDRIVHMAQGRLDQAQAEQGV